MSSYIQIQNTKKWHASTSEIALRVVEISVQYLSHLEVFEDLDQSFIFDAVTLDNADVGVELPVTLRVLRFADGLAQFFQNRKINLVFMICDFVFCEKSM